MILPLIMFWLSKSVWSLIILGIVFVAGSIISSSESNANYAGGVLVWEVVGLLTYVLLVRYANADIDRWWVAYLMAFFGCVAVLLPGGLLLFNHILSSSGAAVIPVWMTVVAIIVAVLMLVLYAVVIIMTIRDKKRS